jgi:Arc/MetJ-type ribon-helix-helix transcriptional regulator
LKKKRPSIRLPDGLERQIAALVGRRGRQAFVREAVRQEIERKKLLASFPKRRAAEEIPKDCHSPGAPRR